MANYSVLKFSNLVVILSLLCSFFNLCNSHEASCEFFYNSLKKSNHLPTSSRFRTSDTKQLQSCLSPDLEEEEKSQCRFFAVVIDAGSTGTRLHIFEFSHDIEKEHSPFKLELETYKEIKPGLSSFTKDPQLAVENIRELILTAKSTVPIELWEHTPITIKATAGFRLLPESDSETILMHVEEEVIKSGLLMTENCLGILSGIDEGVFGWFTLNFLLSKFEDIFVGESNAAAALDLGGGSTQITFLPKRNSNVSNLSNYEDKFLYTINIFAKELTLFTHSYLGNGLIAARLGVSKLSTPEWVPDGPPALKSHCLPKDFILDDYDYAGNDWLISSHNEASFEKCLNLTKYYIWNVTGIVTAPEELLSHDIYAFAYFYDRAVQAAIINFNYDHKGGVAKVIDWRIAAEKACSVPIESIGPENWAPWLCNDLTYIYTLLHYGYGISNNKEINFSKKINRMEVSWSLGASFNLLNTYHNEVRKMKQIQAEKGLNTALARDKEILEQSRKAQEVSNQSGF